MSMRYKDKGGTFTCIAPSTVDCRTSSLSEYMVKSLLAQSIRTDAVRQKLPWFCAQTCSTRFGVSHAGLCAVYLVISILAIRY